MEQIIAANQRDKNNWQVEVFRITSFFPPNQKIDSSSWWESVVGESPDSRNYQPKLGLSNEHGSYEGGRLILSVQRDRADWLFIPAFDELTGGPALDKLPDIYSTLPLFTKFAKQWLNICPPLLRIAFGVILNTPVPDRPTGYRQLNKFLPNIKIDAENSSDFLYQINYKRESRSIPDLQINRLSKWAVIIAKISQIAVGPDLQEYIISPNDDNIFARLELDINTDQEYKGLIQDKQLEDVLSELVELALEITLHGVVP